MTELRKVRKVGGSLTLTIPKEIGFAEDDWIQFEKLDCVAILKKVILE